MLILLGHVGVGIKLVVGIVTVDVEVKVWEERQLDHAACIWTQENGPNKTREEESYGGQFE